VIASSLQTFTYRYSRIRRGDVVEDFPMATAVLSGEDESIRVKLLVDTGASQTFLPTRIARKLKLQLVPSARSTEVAGGTMKIHVGRVRISLADPHPEGRVGRSHVINPVMVVDDTAIPFPVLGREPFLRWYRLTVSEVDREITLQETS
jgi:predicted aspartyl protease